MDERKIVWSDKARIRLFGILDYYTKAIKVPLTQGNYSRNSQVNWPY